MNLVRINPSSPFDRTDHAGLLRETQYRRYHGDATFVPTKRKQKIYDEHGRRVVHRGGKQAARIIDSFKVNFAAVRGYSPTAPNEGNE